jgi:hypothetical protein
MQNKRLALKCEKLQKQRNEQKAKDMESIKFEVEQIDKNNLKIETLETETKQLIESIRQSHEDHEALIKKKNTEFVILVQKKRATIEELREEIGDVSNWMEHESAKLFEKGMLETELEEGRLKHKQNLNEIKRERAAAIEKLRKEMLLNIRNVKIKMLSMNEDELEGTTKLTVRQNIQLSSELEYQSHHIEQLTYQNEKIENQIKLLRVELREHREVEHELAKRSHFCTRVIKRYRDQIKVLKEEIKDRDNQP